jgi:hypothetical protein
MNSRRRRDTLRRRLLALGVFAALLAQMGLPALHGVESADSAPRSALLPESALSAGSAAIGRAAQPDSSHERTSCAVCRSLLRSSPAAPAAVSHEGPRVALTAAPAASELRAPAGVARSGHPPRAPPSDILQLG